jgi:Ca-activated chloride channel family protein
MTRPFLTILLVFSVWMLAAPTASAACVILAGQIQTQSCRCKAGHTSFCPDAGIKAYEYEISFANLDVSVIRGRASIESKETISPYSKGIVPYLFCLMPLPLGAESASASLAQTLLKTEFLDASKTSELCEKLAVACRNPGLLVLSGKPSLLCRSLPSVTPQTELHITWTQKTARSDTGNHELTVPLPAAGFSSRPVARTSVCVTVAEDLPLRSLFSPTHAVEITRQGSVTASIRLSLVNSKTAGDFRLLWTTDRDPLGLRLFTYREPGESDGFFLLAGNPSDGDGPPPAKDLILAIDTSGSMKGEKIEQARAAATYALRHLNPGDRFNLVTFGDTAKSFRPEPVVASPDNIAAALVAIEDLNPQGRTNIDEALSHILRGETQAGRMRIAILLTDGTPTAGEQKPDLILSRAKEGNRSGTRLFTLGIGTEINVHLLDKLALTSGGTAEYLAPEENIDTTMASLVDRLSYPVLDDVKVHFGTVTTSRTFPQNLPVLWRGSPLMLAGRYRDGGPSVVTISGTRGGKPVSYTCQAQFLEKDGGDSFIAPLWAARSIGFLLQNIRINGENKELVDEVVRLSQRYGIVTEYTSFIADSGGVIDKKKAAAVANERMKKANAEVSGAWAVDQARNEKMLQNATIAQSAPITALADTLGPKKENPEAFLRQVGNRTFYQRDGRWVDADDVAKRPLRTMKLLGPEHLKLIRDNPDLAATQELGKDLEINVGTERIRIVE